MDGDHLEAILKVSSSWSLKSAVKGNINENN